MPIELRPHQQKGVDAMHNGCILYGDVGVGKTITSLAYYFTKVCKGVINDWGSMREPRDLVVITTATVRDKMSFQIQAAAFGIHADRAMSVGNVSITVDSWNNITKYTEVKDAFFIFDEQRVVGYGAWSKAFIQIAKHNEWIMLSATPGDTWLDYIPVFIANGWYKNKTDFTNQHVHWVPRVKFQKVQSYSGVGTLVRRRNQVLVQMPYDRHTKRHGVDVFCDYDDELFRKVWDKKWHVYENRPLRDVAELFSVARKVVNSHTSRAATVQRLLEKHPRLIVFYNFDYELEILRTLVPEDQLASPESIQALKAKLDSSENSRISTRKTPSSSTEMSDPSAVSAKSTSRSSGKESTERVGSVESSDTSKPTVPVTQTTGSEPTRRCVVTPGQRSESIELFSSLAAVNGSRSTWESGQPSPQTRKSTHTTSSVTTPSSSPSPSSSTTRSSTPGSTPDGETPPSSTSSSVSTTASDSPSSTATTGQPSSGRPHSGEMDGRFAVAEWNGHKHEPLPETERWLYLVQYRAGAEGWDCITTDAICFYSQTYSYRDHYQVHGRIDRLNTPYIDLYYYYLISRTPLDKMIRAALKAKKSFNERGLKL